MVYVAQILESMRSFLFTELSFACFSFFIPLYILNLLSKFAWGDLIKESKARKLVPPRPPHPASAVNAGAIVKSRCLPYTHFLMQRCHMELSAIVGMFSHYIRGNKIFSSVFGKSRIIHLVRRQIFTEGPGTSLKPSQ